MGSRSHAMELEVEIRAVDLELAESNSADEESLAVKLGAESNLHWWRELEPPACSGGS